MNDAREKREVFAALNMSALLPFTSAATGHSNIDALLIATAAKIAVEAADAVIAELNKEPAK